MTKTNQTQTSKTTPQLFDVIVGNPPYGAKLSSEEQEYLLKKYDFGTTETAILFILKSLDLLTHGGYIGFIIPKSFCFASNYGRIRELIWDNVVEIIDCGKVWNEVKLEQIILIVQKGIKHNFYINKIRNGDKFEQATKVDKKVAKEFGFFLNGISENDIQKARQMKQNSVMLNDIAENKRGAMLQQFISDEGDLEVLGGAEISRDGIKGIKGKIKKENVNDEKAHIKENSILVQRIVAHIEQPTDHIQITACLPEDKNQILVDTINQITISRSYDKKFILAVLNSDTCNWYAYRFVLGKAIRTMQFDNPTTSRLPIPLATPEEQTQIAQLVDQIMDLKKQTQEQATRFLKLLEAEIPLLRGGNRQVDGVELGPQTKSTSPAKAGTPQRGEFSKKLKHFYNLEFSKFLAELEKQKIKLSLSQKQEWQDHFETEKQKILTLQNQTEQVDTEIEELVRELYGVK